MGILLIHGAGMDHSVWRYVRRHLRHLRPTVLAPDLPAHGRSPGPALSSVEEMAGWIAGRWVPIGGEPLIVVGHSLGGLVALELAARLPGTVSHLVLLACAAEMRVHPQLLAAAECQDPRAVDLILGWSFEHHGRSVPRQGGGFPVAARILERGLAHNLAADLRAVRKYRGADTAAVVRAKTLVVVGSGDRMVSRPAVEALAAGVNGATFKLLDGVGHMMMLEAPARIRTLLGDFVPRP